MTGSTISIGRRATFGKATLLWAALWLIAALIVHGLISFPDVAIRLSLLFVLLYGFTGFLTASILRLWRNWSRVQFLTLAVGFGLTEALLLGQAAVLLGLPTLALADGILLLAAAKIIWLTLHSSPPAPRIVTPDRGTIVLLVLGAAGLLLVLRAHRHVPVYTWWPTDSWHYLQVQAQFSDNPGHMNVQEGITAPGTNRRLLWSSWLYNRAMLVDAAQADPVAAQQRDGTYILYLLLVIVYAALGRELLQDRTAGWLAALLQFGIIAHSSFDLLLRVQEDKFFSFYVFMPLVYLVLVRVMREPQRQNIALFVFFTIGLTLIHPFNPIALFLTAVPFVLLRWLFNRPSMKSTLPLVVWMAALLIYPVLVQQTLTGDPFIAEGMAASRSVDWGYRLTTHWGYALLQPDYLSSALILLPILLIAALRRDMAVHFLLAVSAAIIFLLWIPPFAALGALVMTRSQNWRLFMLLPLGYAWAWLALRLWERVSAVLQKRGVNISLARAGWAGGFLLMLAFAWGWPARMNYTAYFDDTGLSPSEREAFAANRAVVGDGRVLTTETLSLALPTLWPDARLAFWRTGALQPEAHRELTAAMRLEADPAAALREYGIEYILLPHDAPLVSYINTEWPCCIKVYENDALILFQVIAVEAQAKRNRAITIIHF